MRITSYSSLIIVFNLSVWSGSVGASEQNAKFFKLTYRTKVSYLVGTHHFVDLNKNNIPSQFGIALKHTHKLWRECDNRSPSSDQPVESQVNFQAAGYLKKNLS